MGEEQLERRGGVGGCLTVEARKARGRGGSGDVLSSRCPADGSGESDSLCMFLSPGRSRWVMEVQRWASGSKVVRPPEAGPAQPEGAGHCRVVGRGPCPVLSGGILEEGPQS